MRERISGEALSQCVYEFKRFEKRRRTSSGCTAISGGVGIAACGALVVAGQATINQGHKRVLNNCLENVDSLHFGRSGELVAVEVGWAKAPTAPFLAHNTYKTYFSRALR